MLQVWATVAEKTLPTVAANYVIWPAAHIISFRYVPSQQRILYNNSVAIFWNCYLSLVAADNGPSSDPTGSSTWSWDAYAFWVGLPGGLDPGITRPFTEVYHNMQSALGIHSPEPVVASGVGYELSKLYHNLQNALGIHSPEPVATPPSALTQMYHSAQSALGIHSPEPVSGLSGLVHSLGPLWGAAAAAPRDEGLVGHLQSAAEAADKAGEAVQGGMHESVLVGSFWLNHILQVRSLLALPCTCSCLEIGPRFDETRSHLFGFVDTLLVFPAVNM